MELVNQIRGNFPKTIDKSKPIFSALIANTKGDAAIQKQLEYLLAYMKEWTSTPNVYEQTGVMLEKTILFFSYLERFADETELSLKNRFRAIFVRNHDTKWGTVYDVKNVFKQYFPHADIYVVENVNKIDATEPDLVNFISDGDFDNPSPVDWTLNNCTLEKDASFSKTYGIQMETSGSSVSQTISALPYRKQIGETGTYKNLTYFLHFFLMGKVNVTIYSSANSKYWDFENKAWKDSAVNNSFEKEDWDNCSLFFITDGGADTSDITITFSYVDTLTYLDYCRLFMKQPYSSFNVIAHFDGATAVGTFGLAAGDDDPNIPVPEPDEAPPRPRYANYGYYSSATNNQSFLSGVPIGFAEDIYTDLLDYLRSQGVRAFLDIVVRDYIPEEI